jgi:hypothetical protein
MRVSTASVRRVLTAARCGLIAARCGLIAARCGLIAAGCGLIAGIGPAAPVSAHPAGVQAAVDYRTTVTGIAPPTPGLEVRFLPDASALQVRNGTGTTVEVLGYQGEPWWRIRPDGVWENTLAPSRFADRPAAAASAGADAHAEPRWHRVSAGTVARWQDHRVVWHGARPEAVIVAPDRDHRLRDWTVPIRVGGREARLTGTLDWVAPPRTDVWVLVILAGVAVVVLVGRTRRRGERLPRLSVAAALAAAGLTAVGYACVVAAHAAGPGVSAFAGQVTGHLLTLMVGVAVLVVAGMVAWRHRAADLLAAMAGFFVAATVGAQNAPVFAHAVTPVPVDGQWARAAIAVVLIGGVGTMIAAMVWARRPAQAAATADA